MISSGLNLSFYCSTYGLKTIEDLRLTFGARLIFLPFDGFLRPTVISGIIIYS